MARNNGRRSFLPVEKRSAGSGAVDPASPSGRYAEAPAAALIPLLRIENSRNPALVGGAMLISPILFFLLARALLVARRADPIRAGCVYQTRPSPRSGRDGNRVLAELLPAGRDGRAYRTRRDCGRPRPTPDNRVSGPRRAPRPNAQPPDFRSAKTRIGRRAFNAGPAMLREISRRAVPSTRTATGDDTAPTWSEAGSVGCEWRGARSGRARTRKGRARGAAGDCIGNGKS